MMAVCQLVRRWASRSSTMFSHRTRCNASAGRFDSNASAVSGDERLERRDEPVPALRDGLDVEGPLGLIAERVADLPDRGVHRLIEVDERIAGPERVANLVARQHAAGAAGQQREQLQRLRRERDGTAVLPKLSLVVVQLEAAKADDASIVWNHALSSLARPIGVRPAGCRLQTDPWRPASAGPWGLKPLEFAEQVADV